MLYNWLFEKWFWLIEVLFNFNNIESFLNNKLIFCILVIGLIVFGVFWIWFFVLIIKLFFLYGVLLGINKFNNEIFLNLWEVCVIILVIWLFFLKCIYLFKLILLFFNKYKIFFVFFFK